MTDAHLPQDPELSPEDFDRALRRLKDDLALKALRRRLLDPTLEAGEILAITRRIETLQGRTCGARHGGWRQRILHSIALISS